MFVDRDICYRDGVLTCEDVPLPQIAEQFGTPAYIYSTRGMLSRLASYQDALEGIPHEICFAVKANSSLAILSTLAKAGAGFDIVSGGELFRALAAGADPRNVVFSGVGKTDDEIQFALTKGIGGFNCESEWEAARISQIAASLGARASVGLRVNPDVDAATHPYISTGLKQHKFGIDIEGAEDTYCRVARLPNLRVNTVSCHIGSQLLDTRPLLEAADKTIALAHRLRNKGLPIQNLDLGGGIGVPYRPSESAASVPDFLAQLRERLKGLEMKLVLEPGRSVVAEAGLLLCRVLLTKRNGKKNFVIVDAGMNDLLRPSLYQAHHEIVPVVEGGGAEMEADIVGPVCETGDFFARNRSMPSVEPGDLLAVQTAGAYGFVLSSNYNSRPRACELLVNTWRVHVARRRETYGDLIRGEALP